MCESGFLPLPRAGICLTPAVIVACLLTEACVDISFVIYLPTFVSDVKKKKNSTCKVNIVIRTCIQFRNHIRFIITAARDIWILRFIYAAAFSDYHTILTVFQCEDLRAHNGGAADRWLNLDLNDVLFTLGRKFPSDSQVISHIAIRDIMRFVAALRIAFLSVTNDRKVYSSLGAICHACFFVWLSVCPYFFLSFMSGCFWALGVQIPLHRSSLVASPCTTCSRPPDRHHLCSAQRSRHLALLSRRLLRPSPRLLPGDSFRAPRLPGKQEGGLGSGRVSSSCVGFWANFESHERWYLN